MALALKYGCNPHQRHAAAELGAAGPVRVRCGRPSMINMLDALNGWQLVAELKAALELPAAASFKHVSPAGAAVASPLPAELRRVYELGNRELTPLATAYARARGADPKCSFGDFVALSDPVDAATAAYLRGVVSDGLIAPGFEPGTLDVLATKKARRLCGAGSGSCLSAPGQRDPRGLRRAADARAQQPPHRLRRPRRCGVRRSDRYRQGRSAAGAGCAQVHAIQLRRLRLRWPDHRRRRRPAVAR